MFYDCIAVILNTLMSSKDTDHTNHTESPVKGTAGYVCLEITQDYIKLLFLNTCFQHFVYLTLQAYHVQCSSCFKLNYLN